MTRRPIVIGIVGGVASGKSEVANRLVGHHGASRINADEIGHSLLSEDIAIQESVVELFGPTILDASKQIDRKKVAGMVFGTDERSQMLLKGLEAIMHPAIRRLAEARLATLRNQDRLPMIVLDAPLLIEAGWDSLCDEILLVDTPIARRKEFAALRGWPADELDKREAAQLSLNEKRAVATRIISNDGGIEELRKKIDDLVSTL